MSKPDGVVTKPPVVGYEPRAISGDEWVALIHSDEMREATMQPLRAVHPLLRQLFGEQLVGLVADVQYGILRATFRVDPKELDAAIKRAAPEYSQDMAAGLSLDEVVDRALERHDQLRDKRAS